MTKRIFRSMVVISVLVLLSVTVLSSVVLYRYFTDQFFEELAEEAAILARSMPKGGVEYLSELRGLPSRLTWIDGEGNVIYDTTVDAALLPSHANREEFTDAREHGTGSTVRFSDTVSEMTFNYALRLSDGSVLRLSVTRDSMAGLLLGLTPWFLGILAVALGLAFLLSFYTARAIIRPISRINLNAPDIEGRYDELAPLLHKISHQNDKIDRQTDELDKRRHELNLVMESMAEGFLIVDAAGDVISCNKSARKMLMPEGDDDTVLGKNVIQINRSEVFRGLVAEALTGKHGEDTLRMDNEVLQIIANPVKTDGSDKIWGVVIVILDVTERALREQLRHEFTSNVSHELKTPLTTIYGISDMLEGGIVKPEDCGMFIHDIKTEASRLITLIDDVIKLSRLDENDSQLVKEEVNLFDLASSIIRRLKVAADAKGVAMRLSGDPVVYFGARAILDEMIYNLCDNAIKYNREGGSVDVTVERRGERVLITVADTGIGIPQQEQNRVFERFYRVDKSHSRKIGGTGLGLSIVKHGALYHGGTVSLTSTEGVGTSITITL